MSQAKHTPGPWEAKWSKYSEGKYLVQTKHPSNRVIASFDDDGDGAGEQSIADAHLIAAAPELLEALKAAHKDLKTASRQLSEDHKLVLSGRGWGWRTLAIIEGAIAKATGEHP